MAKLSTLKTEACHKAAAVKTKTHKGFIAAEHACALGYAVNEFTSAHFVLYFSSAGLLILILVHSLVSFAGREFGPSTDSSEEL